MGNPICGMCKHILSARADCGMRCLVGASPSKDKLICEFFECQFNQCANCEFRIEDVGGYIDCISSH
jgi:hypothetical protein